MIFYSPTNNTNIHYFLQQILLLSPTEIMLRMPSGFDLLPTDDTDNSDLFFLIRLIQQVETSLVRLPQIRHRCARLKNAIFQ